VTLEELRKGNRISTWAVLLTVLTIVLTILIRTIVSVSGAEQRVVALEKAVAQQQMEIQVIHEDIKRLLEKE
jgi:hypothetical protein